MTITKKLATTLLNLPSIDHRLIGARQQLFFFNDVSKGSCFFQPRGARIYNKLIEFLRAEYRTRNYEEIITPNLYNCKLWETSGHWDHYKEHMFRFVDDEKEYSLKPMNCPGHCVMFKQQEIRTSDQLPIRWADFGVLHRNELSGTLMGLTRVRKFQQDDAHIFCTPEQVETEVKGCLDFARDVYKKFGFTFDIRLSLRPKNYMGDERMWDIAEQSLRDALEHSHLNWEEDKYEGAFYGPKIDLTVKDVHERSRQCATIQLDFQLPQRFDLVYKDREKKLQRPIMIHRAILGSIERFIAMIAENCEGKWPFWLSPLQAQVIPVHQSFADYAIKIKEELRSCGYWVDCNTSTETFNAKIRDAITTNYNLILIVGQRESDNQSVTCRVINDHQATDEVEPKRKKTVHNLSLSIEQLKQYLKDFEERQVDCADIELLDMFQDKK